MNFNKDNLWNIIPFDETSLFSNNNTFTEHINLKKLFHILDSGWDYTYDKSFYKSHPECQFPYNTARKHLLALAKQQQHGMLHLKFAEQEVGRCYPERFKTLALLPRKLRQALSIDLYTDHDIANCQPAILYNICVNTEIPKEEYAILTQYINQRDKLIKHITKKLFKSKDYVKYRSLAKTYIISVCFFGQNPENFCKDHGIEYRTIQCVEKLKNAVKIITETYIIPNNTELFKQIEQSKEDEYQRLLATAKKKKTKLPKKRGSKNSLVSKFLQHYERIVIEGVMNVLTETGKLDKKQQFIYEYDGIEILNTDAVNITTDELTTICKELYDFDLVWTIKSQNEGVELLKEVDDLYETMKVMNKHPEEFLNKFDEGYMKSLVGIYPVQKDYFEKFFTFTQKPSPVYWFREEESVFCPESKTNIKKYVDCSYGETKLIDTFKHLLHSPFDGQLKDHKDHCFIKYWVLDPNKNTKRDAQFVPCNKTQSDIRLEDSSYFNTFQGYPDFIKDTDTYTSDDVMLKKFLKYLDNLVDDNPEDGEFSNRNIFLNIIALKIMHPGIKVQHSVLFKSLQGEGKNFLLYIISLIIGSENYYSSSNIEDFVGTHANGMVNKLIINMNELDFAQSKGNEQRLKEISTEEYLTFNKKFQDPIRFRNLLLNIITTNVDCPLKLESLHKERRWIIFQGNGINTRLSTRVWDIMRKNFTSKRFIFTLYQYLATLKPKEYDFNSAKRINNKRPAYLKIASYFIPNTLMFIRDTIFEKTLPELIYKNDEPTVIRDVQEESDSDEEDELDKPFELLDEDEEEDEEEEDIEAVIKRKNEEYQNNQYYNQDWFLEEQTVQCKTMYVAYAKWCDERKQVNDMKSLKSFTTRIEKLDNNGECIVKYTKRKAFFKIKPYAFIKKFNQHFNEDLDLWKDKIPAENYDEVIDDGDYI